MSARRPAVVATRPDRIQLDGLGGVLARTLVIGAVVLAVALLASGVSA
jgi:hypothetical protein